MLAHFGALVETRATLAQQAEAGQERLAHGRALLQRYQAEAGSQLLRTEDELTQLRARLEAAHHDVLQEVRRDMGCPRERGSSMDPKPAAAGRCPTWGWWEAGWHPRAELGVPTCPEMVISNWGDTQTQRW